MPELSPELTRAVASDPLGALIEIERVALEESLHEFVIHFWRWCDPSPFVDSWHLETMCDHLEAVTRGDVKQLLINVPPRMSKSSIVSVLWPAWTWARRERGPRSGAQVQFLFTSYASSLSRRDAGKMRRVIESPEYRRLWGDRWRIEHNELTRIVNSEGGYRLTTSEHGATTGEGGMIIVVDDPHNTVDIESETIMDNTVRWWNESLSSRLNDQARGAYVVIMQRLRQNDLSGHILETEAEHWCHLCLPMRFDPLRAIPNTLDFLDPRSEELDQDLPPDRRLLCPERVDATALVALEKRLGPFGTAGQLQQEPVPRGGGIISADYWQVWPPQGEIFTPQGDPVKKLEYPPVQFILASLDTAMTEDEENDYSAMVVLGLWFDQFDLPQIMLMEAWQERLRLDLLVNRVVLTCRKRRVHRLLIEAKNNGFSVAQEVQRLVRGHGWTTVLDPVPSNMDKAARAHSVQAHFASGQVWAPERVWAQTVIDQCSNIPKGAHDDLADAMIGGVRHMRNSGILQSRDERGDELRRRMVHVGRQEPAYNV